MNEAARLLKDRAANDRLATAGLLAPDEPAPFEILNPDATRPLLLVCDHASRFIPRALGGDLGLEPAHLDRHVAYDIGIDPVTRALARRLEAPAVLSHFSRLIVDPNRQLDDPTLIPQIADGVVVPGNRRVGPDDVERRLATFFRPYHRAVEHQLDAMHAARRVPVIVSMHSFTPVLRGRERPWHVGVLWNRDARLPLPLMRALERREVPVGDNLPYSGRDGHGYTQHVHADRRGLANALIEVRQDLIDTAHGAAEWAARLAEVLEEVLDDPALYRVEHH